MNLLLSTVTAKSLHNTFWVSDLWFKCLKSKQPQTTQRNEMEGRLWQKQEQLTMLVRVSINTTSTLSIQIDKVHRALYDPSPKDAYPGNPFPSSSLSGKSMNTEGHLQRQVMISLTKLHIIQLTRR